MAEAKPYVHELNIGVVDSDKVHRVDLDRMRLANVDQTNVIGLATGKGLVRPGLQYLSANKSSAKARLMAFVAGQMAAFELELTDFKLRVRNGADDVLVTRPAVTSTVPSGDFSGSTGWTLSSAAGQATAISGGQLQLTARARGARASASAPLTIVETGTEHAVEIQVARGPVIFRMGTSAGAQDVIAETTLRTGYHSLAFTPAGTVYVEFSSSLPVMKLVESCQVAAAGVMELTTIWPVAALGLIRKDQSLDVEFLCAKGYKQQRIERHGDRSWSVVDYDSNDGPFLVGRTANITLTPSALEGNATLTASGPFFNAGHLGALFNIAHEKQSIDTYIAAGDQFTPPIKVTGVNEPTYNDRDFTYTLAGTWSGTARVQRSFDTDTTGFQDFRREQASSTIDITANATYIDDDNEDNAITWYRVGFGGGLYTSGELHLTASYDGGNGFGIARVTAITDSTHAAVEILRPFVGLTATDDWREGAWSPGQGYPSAVQFTEGRLIWAGADKVWGSVSDAFDSFDETIVGDSAPLLRSIAIGGRNEANWMMNLATLMVGTDFRVVTVRANSLDDTITPDNFKVVPISKVASAQVDAIDLEDNRALFVQASGVTLYELNYSASTAAFMATPFSQLTTELFAAGVVDLATSAIPDQRIWVANADANAACITFEEDQKVVCSVPIEMGSADDGHLDAVESICVLPGAQQSRVYFSVKRWINGAWVHYTEKLGLDSQAAPIDACMICDSCVIGGAHSTTISVPHLVGRLVVAWVDGAPVETAPGVRQEWTVGGGGTITLPVAPQRGYCVGVPYDWRIETARLEYGVPNVSPVNTVKSIESLSVLFADYARAGIRFGTRNADRETGTLDPLPSRIRGKLADAVVLGKAKDESPYPVPGGASLDQRLIIEGSSPYPASILSYVLAIVQK